MDGGTCSWQRARDYPTGPLFRPHRADLGVRWYASRSWRRQRSTAWKPCKQTTLEEYHGNGQPTWLLTCYAVRLFYLLHPAQSAGADCRKAATPRSRHVNWIIGPAHRLKERETVRLRHPLILIWVAAGVVAACSHNTQVTRQNLEIIYLPCITLGY